MADEHPRRLTGRHPHGYGLDVQEDDVRRWAKDHGHKLVAILPDEGVSGSNGLDTREALPEAGFAVHLGNGV